MTGSAEDIASKSTAICTTLSCGTKFWRVDGMLHREDGPAFEYADGTTNEWWLNGRHFTSMEEFCNAAKMTPEETIIFLLKWSK